MSTRNSRIERLKDKLEQFRDADMTFRYWLKAAPEKLQACVELSAAIRALVPAIEAAIGGSTLDATHESEFYRLTGDFFYTVKSVPTATIRRQAAGGREWHAPGFVDTEIGVTLNLEGCDGTEKVVHA